MSDIHLEFGMNKFMPIEGENLILAGDITCLRCLHPTKMDADNRKLRDRTELFFKNAVENFNNVFYVTGNHESYGFTINREADYIREFLPSKVIHLNDSYHVLDDETVVMGGTLWTDMDNSDPMKMMLVEMYMNDFRYIYTDDKHKIEFTAANAVFRHKTTKQFLADALEKFKDKKVIVVSHHAPTYQGINREHSSNLDPGYASNMENFILDNPNIKAWVFGHTHIQTKFQIGETMLYSNAQGYIGYENTAKTFNPDTWFEV
jgi:predicted phosphohydrolase